MLIGYFDEVRPHPPGQHYLWLAGIVVNGRTVRRLEDRVSELAEECFGSSDLTKATEFHAAAIFNRSENFKTWADPARRVDVLRRLIGIIDDHDRVKKIYVRLDPRRMVKAEDHDEMTFMFLIEKVDALAKYEEADCLLIGDHETDRSASIAARNLSRFRKEGTPYHFGREIVRLVDTVHFTRSHLSRMLQLADVYAWVLQLCDSTTNDTTGLRGQLAAHVRNNTKLLQPHRYKEWPTAGSWLQADPA